MDNYEIYQEACHVAESAREVSALVDEVAICFRSERGLIQFVEEAVAQGLDHFNSVPYDTMKRQDLPGEKFGVRFEFLRWPRYPWRIEAMCVMDGWAPLHDAAMNSEGSPMVIHVSYKMANLQGYQDEVRRLMAHDKKKKAEYTNSYGMFSYWDGPTGSYPYVKPRVNLRD